MSNLLILILVALFPNTVNDLSTQTYILDSDFLSEQISVKVITPTDYTSENEYPLLYLLHGYSADYTQWSQIIDLQQIADEYGFIMVTPDGFKSFYMNSLVSETSQYESFFFYDLVPFVHDQYNIDNGQIFISGLSMGGFGALSLMLARPGFFAAVGSTSGAVEFEYPFWYEISQQFFENSGLADDLESILGSHKDQPGNWKKHSLTNRIDDFNENPVPVFLDIGTEDPLYEMNVKLFENLRAKKIPVHFLIKPGGHDHDYWSRSVYFHLNLYRKLLDDELE